MTDHTHTNPHNPQTDPDDITETRPAAIDPGVVAATPDTVLLAAWSAEFVAGCVNVALGREIRAQFRAAAALSGPEAVIDVAHHLIEKIRKRQRPADHLQVGPETQNENRTHARKTDRCRLSGMA